MSIGAACLLTPDALSLPIPWVWAVLPSQAACRHLRSREGHRRKIQVLAEPEAEAGAEEENPLDQAAMLFQPAAFRLSHKAFAALRCAVGGLAYENS